MGGGCWSDWRIRVDGDWTVSIDVEDGGLGWDKDVTNRRAALIQNDVDERYYSCLDWLDNRIGDIIYTPYSDEVAGVQALEFLLSLTRGKRRRPASAGEGDLGDV